MRTRLALTTFGLVSTLSLSAFAQQAANNSAGGGQTVQQAAAQVTQIGLGNEGRLDGDERLRYPGFEQTALIHDNGYIVAITMQANYVQNEGPVQCSCASYQLQPDGPPKQVVGLTKLTHYGNGERTCNHPKAAADEKGNIVWMFGSDTNSNRPNTYAGIINNQCEQLAAPQMVNIARDANDGAPDIVYNGNGKFTAAYYSDGGGTPTPGFPGQGGRYSVGLGLTVDSSKLLPTLTKTWTMPIITPTDIGRPTLATVSESRTLFCAPEGPDRPSNNIACALVDTGTGNSLWRQSVAVGDKNQQYGVHFNQPTVAKLADDRYALMTIESNAMGKNSNVKGSNLSHLFMLEANGDSMTVGAQAQGVAAHQTHASICTGGYSVGGAPAVGVFSAAPTGIGRAAMQMVKYDDTAKAFSADTNADLWPAAWYGDSGHLSNWYGRNPGKQGRDFMRCIGGVANPGYGVPNGFQNNVKNFFVAAVHGRIPGDAKNSLFLSLIPGESDVVLSPQNPVPAGQTPETTPTTTTTPSADTGNSGGCGCTTPGQAPTNGGALALVGLALAAVVARARRSKKN